MIGVDRTEARRELLAEARSVMTTPTATHRPGCPQPGWDVSPSRSIRGVTIARCEGCGAVELRREDDR